MKTLLLAFLVALPAFAHDAQIPDLPPDATSAQYLQALSSRPALTALELDLDGLDAVVADGERNLEWLQHINARRPANDKLSFTSKETQKGYPIDQPNEYNPTLILRAHADLKAKYPAELARVVFDRNAFTDTPPIETANYLEWSRLLDRSYQSALRWRTMSGWLPHLEGRRRNDIRGYHFLSRLPSRATKLAAFASLPERERGQIRSWLIGLCFNDRDTVAQCTYYVDQAIQQKANLNTLYDRWEAKGRGIYQGYFTIPAYAARRDFTWEKNGANTKLTAPFMDPKANDVRHFVQFNVQDEWKLGNWRLELPFVSAGSHPYIVFEPGATPNVNGLGGDRITMNANQPLTEYDAQWTIRHEFGHVLGLPDCYVEFYERERGVIVNYQIDVENIMCSRKGHVNPLVVKELTRAYGR